ncbi:MAG TPA: hypothetical protein VNZ45_11225, partial [Bacteroidia bacterium]|nr:hypothetical protein [Bacteroidia bacterium]
DWNGTIWINSSLKSITYDTHGNKICELDQYWKNNAWENHERWTYTYDAKGKQTNYVDEIWDGTKWGPWQPMRDGIPQ